MPAPGVLCKGRNERNPLRTSHLLTFPLQNWDGNRSILEITEEFGDRLG